MSITVLIISYLLAFIVFLMIDMLWLGVIAKNIYHKHLEHLLAKHVNWPAAFIFYFIYVLGISIIAIYPAIEITSVNHAILMGALFGFFTYSTYDLTNLATLKNWPITIVIIDIIWGTALSTIVSFCGFHITTWLN
ncbi:DUF2177 family protein [Puteibacter caeruleilacunae]|nr:DUF2177 family protein [Puteibacter caeruleilacunae]